MSEQFRPQPENPKQNSPEAGAGPLGLPPPEPEQPNPDKVRGEAQQIFSPAEQQGAKPFLLTPEHEQSVEALLQPEGEPYDLNRYVIRSLRGLRALEYKVYLTEGL